MKSLQRICAVGFLLAVSALSVSAARQSNGDDNAPSNRIRRQSPSETLTRLALARRVAIVVVAPEESVDPRVDTWIDRMRAKMRTGKKPLFSFATKPPEDRPANAGAKKPGAAKTAASTASKPKQLDTPTDDEQSFPVVRAATLRLFADALTDRLRAADGQRVSSRGEVSAALAALGLKRVQLAAGEGLAPLAERLNVDLVLVVAPGEFDLREGVEREIRAWFRIRASGPVIDDPKRYRERSSSGLALAPPTPDVTTCGYASVGHIVLHDTYERSRLELAMDAAEEAADRAEHTIRTGEADPLIQPGIRVAFTPTPSPERLDKLLFTPEGRRVVVAAVPRDLLFAGDPVLFMPDISPIPTEHVVPAAAVLRELRRSSSPTSSLWRRNDSPLVGRVRALGSAVGADFVFVTRITQLDVNESPYDPKRGTSDANEVGVTHVDLNGRLVERQADAEAVGALIRVMDGDALWQARATATMTALPFRNGKPIRLRSDADVARDAAHFALVQLQREFHDYRLRFEAP